MPQQNCFLPTNCESGAEGNYVSFVLNRFTKLNAGVLGLVHAAVGICGEAGELLDAVKKHWVYGKPLDVQNVIEELGDLEFYAAALRALIGVSREEVIKANVDKLRKRYPDGYTDALAAARLDKVTETQILES
jgi:NTP pyrophosphatase (non-canonical NTP hydrolase)